MATQLALVSAAGMGEGHWSLMVNTLAGAATFPLPMVYWSPFPLTRPGQIGALLGPLAQGWRILASRTTWYAYKSSDQTIIGELLGKDALGVYSLATTLCSTMTQRETGSVVSCVVAPSPRFSGTPPSCAATSCCSPSW